MALSYYGILGVPKDATEEAIKKAYRQAVRRDHPDANPGDEFAEERFKAVQEAYAVLSDPERRKQYDTGQSGGARAGASPNGGQPDPGSTAPQPDPPDDPEWDDEHEAAYQRFGETGTPGGTTPPPRPGPQPGQTPPPRQPGPGPSGRPRQPRPSQPRPPRQPRPTQTRPVPSNIGLGELFALAGMIIAIGAVAIIVLLTVGGIISALVGIGQDDSTEASKPRVTRAERIQEARSNPNPPPGQFLITPKSIGSLNQRSTMADVQAEWGPPISTEIKNRWVNGEISDLWATYLVEGEKVLISYYPNARGSNPLRLSAYYTRSTKFRDQYGYGVGSSIRAISAAYGQPLGHIELHDYTAYTTDVQPGLWFEGDSDSYSSKVVLVAGGSFADSPEEREEAFSHLGLDTQ